MSIFNSILFQRATFLSITLRNLLLVCVFSITIGSASISLRYGAYYKGKYKKNEWKIVTNCHTHLFLWSTFYFSTYNVGYKNYVGKSYGNYYGNQYYKYSNYRSPVQQHHPYEYYTSHVRRQPNAPVYRNKPSILDSIIGSMKHLNSAL